MANNKSAFPYNKYGDYESQGTGKYSYSFITANELNNETLDKSTVLNGFKLQNINDSSYLINAVDINWKGVRVDGVDVASSGHLGYLISNHGGNANFGGQILGNGGIGIPIIDNEQLLFSKANNIKLPNKYINLSDSDDLMQQKDDSSRYLDVILRELSALNKKVNELYLLKETGVHSAINEVTTMSKVATSLQGITEEEPLWATDENTLQQVQSNFSLDNEGVIFSPLNAESSMELDEDHFKITGTCTWYDTADLATNKNGGNGDFKTFSSDDTFLNKEYLFMTTSNLNIKVELTNIEDESKTKIIDLSKLNIVPTVKKKYNIMLILNRSTNVGTKDEPDYKNNNFVWVQIADYLTRVDQAEGYWYEYNDTVKLRNSEAVLGDRNNSRYYISAVSFTDIDIYKFDTYAKYQNFNHDIIPIPPDDLTSYQGTVAHVTIRSLENDEMLNRVKDQLSSNELLYIEETNTLKIKNRLGQIKVLLGGSKTNIPDGNNPNTGKDDNNNPENPTDEGMTQEQIYKWLKDNGIVTGGDASGNNIKLAPINDITFIHQASGKQFKYEAQSDGSIKVLPLWHQTLAERISAARQFNSNFERYMTNIDNGTNLNQNNAHLRGFVGTLSQAELSASSVPDNNTKFGGLATDRIKIAAVYMPTPGQITYGCSHGYVELTNTTDKDFPLDGCYLHICKQKGTDNSNPNNVYEKSLALDGFIPAGGSYLIRGKQYTDVNSPNVFIKVNTYDKEWFTDDKELVNFDRWDRNTFLLTYGCPGNDIDSTSNFNFDTAAMSIAITTASGSVPMYSLHYIDSTSIGGIVTNKNNSEGNYTNVKTDKLMPIAASNIDCIYKIAFELDPAKQAYQGLASSDSSRLRNVNDTDYQIVYLNNPYIEFPKTSSQYIANTRYPVSYFTPKASFEHKNVLTDKTKFDTEKPNMVNCAFGIDMSRTRCFNWLSGGLFDEYLWIRPKGETEWARFESYKGSTTNDKPLYNISRKTFGTFINSLGKEQTVESVVYDRITNIFPGSGVLYTSHKLVLDIPSVDDTNDGKPKEYEYKVGRADINGNPIEGHVSDIYTFTMRSKKAKIRIYQTTDQQGFHWIEYQYWTACANKLNEIIEKDMDKHPDEIPVLLNTGDMSQNGTRINEWLDYYNGGISLFKHLEHNACVGNNDLCNTDVTKLGTGDDEEKSNGYFFHICFCYEIDKHELLFKKDGDNYIPLRTVDEDPNKLTQYYIHKKADNVWKWVEEPINQIPNYATDDSNVQTITDITTDLPTSEGIYGKVTKSDSTSYYKSVKDKDPVAGKAATYKLQLTTQPSEGTTFVYENTISAGQSFDEQAALSKVTEEGQYVHINQNGQDLYFVSAIKDAAVKSEVQTYKWVLQRTYINISDLSKAPTAEKQYTKIVNGSTTKYYVSEKVDYIYEKNTNEKISILPIISFKQQTDNGSFIDNSKYVPSFYYIGNGIGTDDARYIIMFDTEITVTNCADWFGTNYHQIEYNEIAKQTISKPDANKTYYIYSNTTSQWSNPTSGLTKWEDNVRYAERVETVMPINVYTGYTMLANTTATYKAQDFETVYTMLYDLINKIGTTDASGKINCKNIIFACHEMPFTVITNDHVDSTDYATSRSLNGKALVGCHCNQMSADDKKATNWLSRLAEDKGIRIFIGGHKHTYMVTNNIRELYVYETNGVKKISLFDGPMEMPRTLETDTATWYLGVKHISDINTLDTTNPANTRWFIDKADYDDKSIFNADYGKMGNYDKVEKYDETQYVYYKTINTTKFPIMLLTDDADRKDTEDGLLFGNGVFYPYYGVNTDNYYNKSVKYLMCQATGFKLKSNKELPTNAQRFSMIIPKTKTGNKPDANQQYAMFARIYFGGNYESNQNRFEIERFKNITNGTALLTQQVYSNADIKMEYLVPEVDGKNSKIYGRWVDKNYAGETFDETIGIPVFNF